jgi:hypothetical protein
MGWGTLVSVSVIAGAPFFETRAFADATVGAEAAGQPLREPDPSWQVNTSLSAGRYSIGSVTPNASTDGLALNLEFRLRRYFAPLRDDAAPYSLQPFLQRASSWSLTLDGGHFSTRNPFGGQDRTDWNGGVSGAVDAYVRRWLILNGGFGYGFSALRDVGVDQSTHTINGFVDVGLRVADTRIDAWYGLTALETAGSFAPARQRFGATAFTAIARRFTLGVSGASIPSGVEGSASLEYYATRELGIFGGTFAGRGKLYSTDAVPTRYAGWVGLAGWIDPTVGVSGQYELTVENFAAQPGGPSDHNVTHTITLEVFARFDQM